MMVLQKKQISVIEVLKFFDRFSKVSGLKPNTSKCQIAGVGSLNGTNVVLCGMQYVDLKKESLKILGNHFSYNNILEQKKLNDI